MLSGSWSAFSGEADVEGDALDKGFTSSDAISLGRCEGKMK